VGYGKRRERSETQQVKDTWTEMLLDGFHTAVFEKVLFGLLQFYNEAVAIETLAINIEHCPAVNGKIAQVFISTISQVFNFMVLWQQAVQEIDEQILIHLFAKEALKTKIGEGVDVSGCHAAKVVKLTFEKITSAMWAK